MAPLDGKHTTKVRICHIEIVFFLQTVLYYPVVSLVRRTTMSGSTTELQGLQGLLRNLTN